VLSLMSAVALFAVSPAVPAIVRRIGKKRGFLGSAVLGAVAGVGVWLAPTSSPAVPLVFFALLNIAIAGGNAMMFALEADTVEYGEWRTGVRTEGITYAAFSFTRKLGQAVGGAAAAYAIALGGYVANAPQQSDSSLAWISAAAGLLPALFMLAGAAIFVAYPLTERRFAELVAETRARREAAHAAGRADTGAAV
jgi:glucuronide carrier protein